jgi:hypothetical protein
MRGLGGGASWRPAGQSDAIVITHPDAEPGDCEAWVRQLHSSVGPACVPTLLPDGTGKGFHGVQRAVHGPAYPWRKALLDRGLDAREQDTVLERFLEPQELSEEELRRQCPLDLAKGRLVLILVCDLGSELGIQQVLTLLTGVAGVWASAPRARRSCPSPSRPASRRSRSLAHPDE